MRAAKIARPPYERSLDRKLDQLLAASAGRRARARSGAARRSGTVSYPSPAIREPVALELGRPRLVAQAKVCDRAQKQVARVAHARRREIRRRSLATRDPFRQRARPSRRSCPPSSSSSETEWTRWCAESRCERSGVQLRQPSCLVEAADRRRGRRPASYASHRWSGSSISDSSCEPSLAPRRRLVEAPVIERGLRFGAQRERAELDAVELLGQPASPPRELVLRRAGRARRSPERESARTAPPIPALRARAPSPPTPR